MCHRIVVGVIAALCIGVSAWAATVPTSYLVDDKALRREAPVGTPITFELYEDASCSSLVASEVVAVEDVLLRERIQQAKVKGGARPAKLVELHHAFQGVAPTPGADLFVRVTGTGIDSSALGDCQVQEPFGDGNDAGGGGITGVDLSCTQVSGTVGFNESVANASCPTGSVLTGGGFFMNPSDCGGGVVQSGRLGTSIWYVVFKGNCIGNTGPSGARAQCCTLTTTP